jgi:hypothetical protein
MLIFESTDTGVSKMRETMYFVYMDFTCEAEMAMRRTGMELG